MKSTPIESNSIGLTFDTPIDVAFSPRLNSTKLIRYILFKAATPHGLSSPPSFRLGEVPSDSIQDPQCRWTDYIEDLGWNRLGLRPSEMMEVVEDREVWRLNLELLPPQPSRKSGQWRKKKKKHKRCESKVQTKRKSTIFSYRYCLTLTVQRCMHTSTVKDINNAESWKQLI